MKKRILLLISALLLVFTLASCKKNEYKITLTYDDGFVYLEETLEEGSSYILPTPSKDGYTFKGWYLEDTLVTSINDVTSNLTVVARFEINSYVAKFYVNGELYHEVTLPYGSTIEYPEDPSLDTHEGIEFLFKEWDNKATELYKDEVFNATFNENVLKFKYQFINEDGSLISSFEDVYGATINYPSNPTKEETEKATYEFVGWDKTDTVLTADITFKAIFKETIKKYTCTFLNEDGSLIEEQLVEYGKMPVEPKNLTKEEVDGIKYKFVGWDKTVEKVTKDVTYQAVFEEYVPTLENMKVSILGDSISTFYKEGSEMNSYYTGTNQFYYPTYSATVKSVDLTWWYKLIKNNKMTLGINNSWSGSCAYGTIPSAAVNDSRINTIDDNGTPDMVIIYLGTNDVATGYSASEFESAIVTMINKIRKLGVNDIFLVTLGYSAYTGSKYTDSARLEYNEKLREIAKDYNCGIIPLDEYVVNDNYMIYLGDFLHYNAKGAHLLSEVCEKSIKEYYGIEFGREIEVEHKELLPEGVLGKVTATADNDFWENYATGVFLVPSSFTNPTFSTRIEISKKEDGTFYVSRIQASGEANAYSCDYVLIISEKHEDYGTILMDLTNVVVGSIVEFDENGSLPKEIIFKESDGSNVPVIPEDPKEEENEKIEGMLYIGAYNTGVWTMYEKVSIVYSDDAMDKNSTYENFNMIKLKKAEDSENYIITGLKPVGEKATFESDDLYVLIFSSLEDNSFYENAKIGNEVVIHGNLSEGHANLEFK